MGEPPLLFPLTLCSSLFLFYLDPAGDKSSSHLKQQDLWPQCMSCTPITTPDNRHTLALAVIQWPFTTQFSGWQLKEKIVLWVKDMLMELALEIKPATAPLNTVWSVCWGHTHAAYGTGNSVGILMTSQEVAWTQIMQIFKKCYSIVLLYLFIVK